MGTQVNATGTSAFAETVPTVPKLKINQTGA
jgi:hypothetical protein